MASSQLIRFILLACLLVARIFSVDGLAVSTSRNVNRPSSRRAFLSATAATATLLAPQPSLARYVLNEDGEYDEVEDEDWQTAWGKRLDKARSMSTEDVFLAAQGAGNLDLKEGDESAASKKRRAFAGCRNERFRERSGARDVKECTSRVMGEDYQFMIDAMAKEPATTAVDAVAVVPPQIEAVAAPPTVVNELATAKTRIAELEELTGLRSKP